MPEYAAAAGFVQKFPDKDAVAEKEVNGQTIREFVIRTVATQKLVKVTLWPEYKDVVVSDGDFVAVDGKFEQSLGQGRSGQQIEYLSISPYKLVVVPAAERAERGVVQKAAPAEAKSREPLF